jgi:hypothetical protein
MESLRKEAEAMEVARHVALDSVRQADSRLTEWEDKVRYAKFNLAYLLIPFLNCQGFFMLYNRWQKFRQEEIFAIVLE